MKVRQLAIALVSAQLALGTGLVFAHDAASGNHAAKGAMSDEKTIEHVMKAQFDKPQSPLKVAPVAIEGAYAVAGWVQDDRGGRALLKKEHGKWIIQVCGGDGLKDASALTMTGMTEAGARNLARKVSAAEAKLPAEQVRKFAMFEGMIRIEGETHAPHGAHGASTTANAHPAPAGHAK